MSRKSDEADFYKERQRRLREERQDAERRKEMVTPPQGKTLEELAEEAAAQDF